MGVVNPTIELLNHTELRGVNLWGVGVGGGVACGRGGGVGVVIYSRGGVCGGVVVWVWC